MSTAAYNLIAGLAHSDVNDRIAPRIAQTSFRPIKQKPADITAALLERDPNADIRNSNARRVMSRALAAQQENSHRAAQINAPAKRPFSTDKENIDPGLIDLSLIDPGLKGQKRTKTSHISGTFEARAVLAMGKEIVEEDCEEEAGDEHTADGEQGEEDEQQEATESQLRDLYGIITSGIVRDEPGLHVQIESIIETESMVLLQPTDTDMLTLEGNAFVDALSAKRTYSSRLGQRTKRFFQRIEPPGEV